mgnify:CR=1 FL=1|jgi:cytidylate kinase
MVRQNILHLERFNMHKKRIAIAIDGPGGAGKSTIAKHLAKELDILYLDTGAMYRACGLKAARQNMDLQDREAVAQMLDDTKVDIRFVSGLQRVFLDDEDVSEAIRTPEMSVWASDISVLPCCRKKLVALQREIAADRSVVMDGRDIGSYVLPQAELKIFLTATPEVRAMRRYKELVDKGDGTTTYDHVLQELAYRDQQDSSREFAPLVCTPDAYRVDTSEMDIDTVVRTILNLYEEKICDQETKE